MTHKPSRIALILSLSSTLIFTSGNAIASDDFEQFKQQFMQESESYNKAQTEDFNAYLKAHKAAFAEYKKELSEVWGDKAAITDKTTWVTHSDDLKTQNEVDFKQEEIRISVLVDKDLSEKEIQKKLTDELVKLADTSVDTAQKEDPINKRVEKIIGSETLAAKMPPKPKPDNKPVIQLTKKPVSSTQGNEEIVKLVKTAKVVIAPAPKVVKKTSNKQRIVMTVPLPSVATSSKASRYKTPVNNASSKWKMDNALVMAVIHTESSFNPMARSHIPAYGLMQIVPRSAGQDASALIYGNSRMLTSSYLFTPDKNINVGAAYLHILDKRYLKKIENPESRLYCVIAAYNTGAGNVARAFTGKTSVTKAAPKINSMTPYQVYNHLLRNLPHDETKDYLKRVTSRYEAYKKGVL